MKAPAIPEDETYRLDALRSLDLLDTAAEADFDSIVQLGRELFDVPICLVSLVDQDRQWFKARAGLDATETPRAVSFCGHAILEKGALVILDALKDERFSDNPLVTGGPGIRFYAGMPIELPSGYRIGTVCIIDMAPRQMFGAEEIARLGRLSELTLNAIAVRAMRIELDAARMIAERYRVALHLSPVSMALAGPDGRIEEANQAFSKICRLQPVEGRLVADALGLSSDVWLAALKRSDVDGKAEIILIENRSNLVVISDPRGLTLIERLV
jgi:PAS domain-containing protein